jgi:thiol-disulfide isomerase/thioredoxin
VRRVRDGDQLYMLVGLVALLALGGFIAYAVISSSASARTPAVTGRTGGTFPDPPPPSLRTGTAAPQFVLPSIEPGGSAVRLSAARGEPAVVGFFASWCRDCRADLDAFAIFARREAGHVVVIGIDTNDGSGAAARPLLRAAGSTYAVGVDPKGTVATRYLLVALPTTYFLDSTGRVVGVAFGPQDAASLASWAARLTGSGSR